MLIVAHGLDHAGQLVLDAAGARLRGQADVAGQHPNPHPPAGRQTGITGPEAAAVEVGTRQMPARVDLADRRVEHRTGLLAQAQRQVEPHQQLLQRPVRPHPPGLERDQMVGQPRHLVRRMGDIEHRDVEFLAQPLQVGQDLLAARVVQRRQRLVHQQQARPQRQRPGDADALALAARQPLRAALEQRPDAQQRDRLLQPRRIGRCAEPLQAVAQIAQHAQVIEQAGLLEDIADRAPVHRQPVPAVLPDLAVDRQPALRRALQPRHAAQQRGLARTRVAEQHRHAAPG